MESRSADNTPTIGASLRYLVPQEHYATAIRDKEQLQSMCDNLQQQIRGRDDEIMRLTGILMNGCDCEQGAEREMGSRDQGAERKLTRRELIEGRMEQEREMERQRVACEDALQGARESYAALEKKAADFQKQLRDAAEKQRDHEKCMKDAKRATVRAENQVKLLREKLRDIRVNANKRVRPPLKPFTKVHRTVRHERLRQLDELVDRLGGEAAAPVESDEMS